MGKKSSTTQTNRVNTSPEFDRLASSTLNNSLNAFNGVLTEYDGQRVSDFSDDELTAQQKIRDLTNRDYTGAQDSLLQTAIDRFGRAPTSKDLEAFLNPYQRLVTDRAVDETVEGGNEAMARLRMSLGKSGAWGGSNMVFGQTELADETADRIGDLTTTSNRDNYNQAYARYMDQGNSALSTAGYLDNLTRGDIDLLDASGVSQRRLDQTRKDFEFSEFDKQRNIGRADALSASQILAAYPSGTFDSSTKTTNKSSDPAGTVLGAALMTVGAFTGNPALIAAGVGGIAGAGKNSAATPTASANTGSLGGNVTSGVGALQGMSQNVGAVGSTGLNDGWLKVTGKAQGGPIRSTDGLPLSRGESTLLDNMRANLDGRELLMPDDAPGPRTLESRVASYFENPLTKLGVSILSSGSIGEGLGAFAMQQKAEKDQAYERDRQERAYKQSVLERAMEREDIQNARGQQNSLTLAQMDLTREQNELARRQQRNILATQHMQAKEMFALGHINQQEYATLVAGLEEQSAQNARYWQSGENSKNRTQETYLTLTGRDHENSMQDARFRNLNDQLLATQSFDLFKGGVNQDYILEQMGVANKYDVDNREDNQAYDTESAYRNQAFSERTADRAQIYGSLNREDAQAHDAAMQKLANELGIKATEAGYVMQNWFANLDNDRKKEILTASGEIDMKKMVKAFEHDHSLLQSRQRQEQLLRVMDFGTDNYASLDPVTGQAMQNPDVASLIYNMGTNLGFGNVLDTPRPVINVPRSVLEIGLENEKSKEKPSEDEKRTRSILGRIGGRDREGGGF